LVGNVCLARESELKDNQCIKGLNIHMTDQNRWRTKRENKCVPLGEVVHGMVKEKKDQELKELMEVWGVLYIEKVYKDWLDKNTVRI